MFAAGGHLLYAVKLLISTLPDEESYEAIEAGCAAAPMERTGAGPWATPH